MKAKYPSIANPQPDVGSLVRSVQDLKLGYQALVGVPKDSDLQVANNKEIMAIINEINKRLTAGGL